jgi:hypothetical protein
MLYHKLHTLADEYEILMETFVLLAVQRLIDDVDLFRKLRTGELPQT